VNAVGQDQPTAQPPGTDWNEPLNDIQKGTVEHKPQARQTAWQLKLVTPREQPLGPDHAEQLGYW